MKLQKNFKQLLHMTYNNSTFDFQKKKKNHFPYSLSSHIKPDLLLLKGNSKAYIQSQITTDCGEDLC